MARRVAVLLTLAALLAGCMQSGGPDGTAPGPGDAADDASLLLPAVLEAPTLLPPVDLGRGAGEPNIAVSPLDGTIYAADPSIGIWRSTDGARSFEKMAAENIEGGGDGDIGVDLSGRLHWLGLFGVEASIPYQFSDNNGKLFSEPVDTSDGTGSDREWMDVTPDGRVYTAWRDADGYAFNASLDRGETWQGKVRVFDDALGGPVVHDPSNASRLYIPLVTSALGATSEEPGAAILVMRSDDGGATWDSSTVASARGGPGDPFFVTQIFPVVAVDQTGNLYLVASLKSDTFPSTVPKPVAQYGVLLWVSKDQGATWSAPRLLSPDMKASIMPWVAAGAPGRIAVVWYENVAGLPNDVLPDLWNVKLFEAIGLDGDAPQTVVAQLNGDPNHIGSVCTNGTLCVAGGDRSLLDFFEVAIKADGHPVAVWTSTIGGTGVGLSAVGPNLFVGGVADGTPLR